MAIKIATGFDVGAEVPIDARTVADSISARNALVTSGKAYEGMRVYVKADKQFYKYIDGAWSVDGMTDDERAEINRSIGAVQTAAENAQITANTANTAAGTAQTTANTAKSAAETAQGTASAAQTAADNAQITANTAVTAAGRAQTAADNAQTAAGNAQSSADNALLRADEANAAVNDVSADLSETNTEMDNISQSSLRRRIVQSLPSATLMYDFEDGGSVFTVPSISSTVKGISTVVEDEITGNHYQYVSSTGAAGASSTIGSSSNVYSRFTFPETMTNDVKIMTVEFDFQYVSNKRMTVALADLDVLNGLGNANLRYLSDGVAFDIFSTDNTEVRINGSGGRYSSFFGQWLHAKVVIDFTVNTAQYIITQISDSTIIMSGTKPFRDETVTRVTGIALYTWQQSDTVYFDNISVTSEFVIRENVIYMIPSGIGYRSYIYVNEVPYALITPSESIYRDTPVQIGTWLDGRPIWRVAFTNRPIPYLEEETTLYTDKSYTPLYDYEHRCSKYVKSTSGVLLLNGMMQLDVSGETVLCKRWSSLEYEADIGNLNGFIRHETMYFTGYAEFVTAAENIKE